MRASQPVPNRAAVHVITGRPEKLNVRCPLCGARLPHPEYARRYPNLVCRECDGRAVNQAGLHPQGENPVFIDGKQCWRRYRFGSHLTMYDDLNCASMGEFLERAGTS